jgi:hypothetical protein
METKIQTFAQVMRHLEKEHRKTSLLMGNGFSMAFDKSIFSYNALFDFVTSKKDVLINKLFNAIKTKNFELVMQQLDTTLALLDTFGAEKKLKEKISDLLNAIQSLHPEHVFKVPEERSIACANFLNEFLATGGHIYTTNYDLLLYWVLMREGVNDPVDGFGRDVLNIDEVMKGEDKELSDLLWGPNVDRQNIHYLHGALHLFDTGTEILKEEYSWDAYLLENIKSRLECGNYPIFVTAGNGLEKLEHIRHNRYLTHCYDQLSQLDGSLVTFGFNFGTYDEHINDALNRAAHVQSKMPPKLWSIYIGVYSDSDIEHINSIKNKFRMKVNIYDAKTANVWGTA